MPTNKVLADDDPELLELLKGGGLKADTIKDRERFLGQFKEFVLKETGGVALEDLVLTKEGLKRLDKLFPSCCQEKVPHSTSEGGRGVNCLVSGAQYKKLYSIPELNVNF